MRGGLRAGAAGAVCALAGLLGLLVTGCIGSPRPEFYRLEASALDEPPLASRPELGLAVGPLDLPRYLDRPEIVSRQGPHGLLLASAQRWAGSLRGDILRVVADDLGALLGTPRVVTYPVQPRFPVAWRVLLDVRSFEGVRGQSVVLRVRWTIASGVDGHAVAVEESTVDEKVASDSWDAYVAAHTAALGVVTHQIAERIASLPPPAHKP